tara:strand:- start:3680 stop:4318 length:639 start_codon:yes stop_codon:yes gene_type:complete
MDNLELRLLVGEDRAIASFRGLCTILHLCRVNKRWSEIFACRDPQVWSNALDYLRATTTNPRKSSESSLLPDVEDTQRRVSGAASDTARAAIYKRDVITFVLYRLALGPVAYTANTKKDANWPPVRLEEQIKTFMSRGNGSKAKVVKELNEYLVELRRRDGDMVPDVIPTEFVVRLIKFLKTRVMRTVYNLDPPKNSNLKPILDDVRKKQWY